MERDRNIHTMNISDASIDDLVEMTEQDGGAVESVGLTGSSAAYCLARLYSHRRCSILVVVPELKDAQSFMSDMRFFLESGRESLLFFPPYDIVPFKAVSYNPETAAHRISTLYRLITEDGPKVLITTIGALAQKIVPKGVLSAFPEIIMPAEDVDRNQLIDRLISGGYAKTSIVEEYGDMAVRGSLIDLFSPLYPDPVRIEFFGDTVESIRAFSARSQQSIRPLKEAVILPASEAIIPFHQTEEINGRIRSLARQLEVPFAGITDTCEQISARQQFPGIGGFLPLIYPEMDNLIDYLTRDFIPALVDAAAIEKRGKKAEEAVTESYLACRSKGSLCVEPELCYQSCEDAVGSLRDHGRALVFRELSVSGEATRSCGFRVEKNEEVSQELRSSKGYEHVLRPLVDWIKNRHDRGCVPTAVCADQKGAERIEALLGPYGINTFAGDLSFKESPGSGGMLRILPGRLSSGFVWEKESVAIITEKEMFGPKRRRSKPEAPCLKTGLIAFEDLKEGDLTVHIEHGIGRYDGLVKLELNHYVNDFILIKYQGNDRLYLPVDRLHNLQKYRGVEGVVPRLDRLGGRSWERVKEKVKKSVEKTAKDLLQLYAWRKVQKGFAFSADDAYFEQFEMAFEYEETPDQARCIDEVLADMERETPMDRLVCGDVGYGKTEVAMRAAFKAVCDNKQVALLVPTTVLLEQHIMTFNERFKRYPVIVEGLSRFRSPKQQKEILARLGKGKIDLIVGTHRLLQKGVVFKDLGLIIIDEEQRFGVKHKEKLKKMCRHADVLALSATPIPRTLHMSMTGIRDLSVIMTPPERRYPIKTYISRFDDAVIAEAIMRERNRGGQIFFVHNNITSIWNMARYIQNLAPDARIGVAHGRLDEKALEKVMFRFIQREIDLLVCTTIIESGLDIPSANTIMINRADKFGLAQMYQLRGRVGRGEDQAYAYLFIPGESAITKKAQKRLRVLMEHDRLGAGFQIAFNDLQIRGGGSILGTSQSGRIAAVGYEMYLQLMEEAMHEIKGEPIEKAFEPEINIGLSAFLPEEYISDIDQRLACYKRLSRMTESGEPDRFRRELADRYGPLPEEAKNLMEKIGLKVLARKARIINLDLSAEWVVLTFDQDHHADADKIINMVNSYPENIRVTPDMCLKARLPFKGIIDPVEAAGGIIGEIIGEIA
jgi:transcription-repair coupling factor (superfamily II helicase)